MSRTKIHTDDFAEALLRNASERALQSNEHLLADYKFGNDFCYPLIDRDRGPKYNLPIGHACRVNSSAHDNRAYLPNKACLRVVRPIASAQGLEYIKSKSFGHIDGDE